MSQYLERVFHLKENGTNVKTEIMAGVITFMTMAYILAVNPNILAAAGMDAGAVFTATALASAFATLLMAAFSNYPFVLAPGMGLNAFFAYTVVIKMGYTWHVALAAVFVEGLLFIILSLTNVREAIFNCIPHSLKMGVSGGIGLFIAFIGLQNSKMVVSSATLVTIYPIKESLMDGTFFSTGIGAVLAFAGVLLTGILMMKKVPGAILVGILGTWGAAIVLEISGIYVPNLELGMMSALPDFSSGFSIPSISSTFFKMDFSGILSFNFVTIMLSFLFVDLFDTLGTLIGVASKADMLDEKGALPKIKGALLADAVGTTAGAVLGTSTVTTFVESSSGVISGGRTGLTSVTAAVLFLSSLFLSPVFLAIPSFATAPALIIVGFLMMSSLLKIDFDNIGEALPAFISCIAMPFMYSISEGISLGVITYVLINLVGGKAKKINPIMYVLSVLFVLKYLFV